ncbi:MAG TPA: hypothetical protein VLC50_04000 [Actinomycetes bacterium]|nr:hypothetical protein [Actinomycetes bacterium]
MAEHDPIADRLDALRGDVETLRLASPAAVRRRGDVRRARRTAVTGVTALLVLAAGAGAAFGVLGGDRGTQQSVATPPTASSAPPTSPTPTPSPTAVLPLDPAQAARAALLPADALDADATAEERFPDTDLNPCRYDNDQPHDVTLWQVISTAAGTEVHQRVIVWPDVSVAKSHWNAVHNDLVACPAASGRYGPLQVSPMGPLAGGWAIELPSGAAPTQVYAAGFNVGRVTSEIYFTDPSAPAGAESVRQSQFHALADAAAQRLANAVHGNSAHDETAATAPPSSSP